MVNSQGRKLGRIRKELIMASKEINNKSLREFLKEKADKVSLKALEPSRMPWMTNRDVSYGMSRCDPKKIAPTRVELASESNFMAANMRGISAFEYEKNIEESGNADELPSNFSQYFKNKGVIRNDGNFLNPVLNNKNITECGNSGTIYRILKKSVGVKIE